MRGLRTARSKGGALWIIVLLAALMAGGAYWHFKGQGEPKPEQGKAPGAGAAKPAGQPGPGGPGGGPGGGQVGGRRAPVGTAKVERRDVEVYISGLGSVTPLNVVMVKSRVDGELMNVNFQEGQMVKRGELLLEIDTRPFKVQLAQAEGQLARDMALLENARRDLKRYQSLVEIDAVARQQFDTQESLVRQYEGTVKLDQAQVDNAKLQLTYCRITAPLNGRVGLRKLDPGNMVKASDASGLLVITQMEPISVVFSIAEDNLPKVREKLAKAERLPVLAFDREHKRELAQGWLTGLDNQIDATTGTVKLKAFFPNQDLALFPNQFVNARLRVDVLNQALVLPTPALQRGQGGQYVYVVKPDLTVEPRNVEVGETQEGTSVINKGVTEGEIVVVDGADRLRSGAPVEIREGPKP